MMIRIFSSKYIVAALAMMAMTMTCSINNSNGVVYAEDACYTCEYTGKLCAVKFTECTDSSTTCSQDYTGTLSKVDCGSSDADSADHADTDHVDSEDHVTDAADAAATATDAAAATATDAVNNSVKVTVSSASLLSSSMMGIAAVTTAFVAMA